MSEGKVMQTGTTGEQAKTKVGVQEYRDDVADFICKSSRIQKRKSQYL